MCVCRRCVQGAALFNDSNIEFACLAGAKDTIVETYPGQHTSLSVLSWFKSQTHACDVVHVHEWGGIFKDLALYIHMQQGPAGCRLAVEPHGGHVWSQQGRVRVVCGAQGNTTVLLV
jgi:hypothetical protein